MMLVSMPSGTRGRIFQKMDVDALLTCSLTSPKVRGMIQRLDWRVAGTNIDLVECRGCAMIQCRSYAPTSKCVTFELLRDENGNKLPKMRINETVFDLSVFDEGAKLIKSWSDDMLRKWFSENTLYIFAHLFGPVNDVSFAMHVKQMADVPSMNNMKHCFIIDENAHGRDITKFCQRFVGRTLILHPVIQGSIDSDTRMMRVPYLYVRNAEWLTGSHLMRYTGKSAFLDNASIYTKDIIKFVTKWLNGTDRRLKSVVIRIKAGMPVDLPEILRNLDGVKTWDPKERERYYFYRDEWKMSFFTSDLSLLDCSDGFDIVRKSDNMLCTIRMSNLVFCFYVWHNRFPTDNVFQQS
ncbi:hypothetical protein GCK72_025098 [Caenorhabditis remanei]|uniref:Sdz-33 F-box domain-containing protein n=1 Tax=Caenorhabditis remanei TaxID=31234 RepID=A0A6A5G1J1_CAERE|nr:hypothetical protein GCK72_025098 [Caenorhabditis remanei]KAF1748631.1 hypothetical protein GCK72_025098 [Caenorhabditis remanei]